MMNSALSRFMVWYPAFYLRGQAVGREMRKLAESWNYEEERIREIQFEKFKRLLAWSYENIDFYREKYNKAGIVPADIRSFGDMGKVPPLLKGEIRENGDAICNGNYRGKRFRRATSGSTGMPLVFHKDNRSMAIMDAVLYRNYGREGIRIGDRQARFWGHPLDRAGRLKVGIVDFLLNRRRLSPFSLEAGVFEEYLERIRRFGAHYLYGYAQSIYRFALYFYERGVDLSHLGLKAVILTGEMVFPGQIEKIKAVFGCVVNEEYGCTEVGVIGFRCRFGKMHVMENLLVESVGGDADSRGGELIVSELYGELFPFIRYSVGDRARIEKGGCECGSRRPVLGTVLGRNDEFIRCPGGRLVEPYLLEYIIDGMPRKLGEIRGFRIEQTSLCLIEIFFVGDCDLHGTRSYFKKKFMKVLPREMEVEIGFRPFLEPEPSGKNRCFVSKI